MKLVVVLFVLFEVVKGTMLLAIGFAALLLTVMLAGLIVRALTRASGVR